MDFGTGNGSRPGAWKDIWGSGQGIGVIERVEPVAAMIDRFERQYLAAKARLGV